MFGSRDLRLVDNDALFAAHNSGLPLLLVYFFEPSVMNYDDADVRHWRLFMSPFRITKVKPNQCHDLFFS
jgi:deoxyribodipyrimidine photo-lyase